MCMLLIISGIFVFCLIISQNLFIDTNIWILYDMFNSLYHNLFSVRLEYQQQIGAYRWFHTRKSRPTKNVDIWLDIFDVLGHMEIYQ